MGRYVNLTGIGSTKLALSFYPAASLPGQQLYVCPPLLRSGVFCLKPDARGRFLLAYVLNQGYTEEIVRWHAKFPAVELHCFCEKPKIEPVWRYDSTLWFHKLDGTKFLQMMAESRGVACTAGFESVNEAAWLGKPLLVVPVGNHIEQYLNALDAEKAGLAVSGATFDLTPLLTQPIRNAHGWYRDWVGSASQVLLTVLEQVVHRRVRKIVPAYSASELLQPNLRRLLQGSSADKSADIPVPAASSPAAMTH
jgi:uncharacterized protein (TIGR00661 family)